MVSFAFAPVPFRYGTTGVTIFKPIARRVSSKQSKGHPTKQGRPTGRNLSNRTVSDVALEFDSTNRSRRRKANLVVGGKLDLQFLNGMGGSILGKQCLGRSTRVSVAGRLAMNLSAAPSHGHPQGSITRRQSDAFPPKSLSRVPSDSKPLA